MFVSARVVSRLFLTAARLDSDFQWWGRNLDPRHRRGVSQQAPDERLDQHSEAGGQCERPQRVLCLSSQSARWSMPSP